MLRRWNAVRPESVAGNLFLMTVILFVGSVFALSYWDSIVEPVINITGAMLYSLSLPALFGILGILFVLMIQKTRMH